jgi:osmoprotectant transport system permease protein
VEVGSKVFTESVILAEIAVDRVQAAGVPATHRKELGGTRVLWTALVSGDLDVYPEYTGTIRPELLGGAEGDLPTLLARHGVAMTPSLGFSDTYALGMTRPRADALGVASISDLRAHPDLRLGLSNEFLERAYGLPHADVRGLQHDLAYTALAAGQLDVVDLYTTDAEIALYDLRVLADDRSVFPEYEAVFLYRTDLDPRAVAALQRAGGTIDAPAMIAMNSAVKVDRRPEAEVAAEHVATLGLTADPRSESLPELLLRTTGEHLRLVSVSLIVAIGLALPLGVAAAKVPRLAPPLLGLMGIVQTVPSIALLVALIPLLGIGEGPALVALVLYGLLPIARNTHAGLTSIPAPLQESAEALGLPPWAKLWRIELPLAAGAILAGVQTAAVVNVGTATIGALVGAGGYGQPILSGIRLARADLLLIGAVPAAGLALLLQGLFGLVESRWVRRG